MKTTINLRIDENLKNELGTQADEENISISEHIRQILENHLKIEIPDLEENVNQANQTPENTIDSPQFNALILWILHDNNTIFNKHLPTFRKVFKKVIGKLFNHDNIPENVMIEFEKTLNKLTKEERNPWVHIFTQDLYKEEINRELILEFILNRYNDEWN